MNWKIDPKGTAATLFPFSVSTLGFSECDDAVCAGGS